MNEGEQISAYLYASMIPVMQTINDSVLMAKIALAGDWLASPIFHGNKLICIGNGGSMADASHFASELTGKYRFVRPSYAAVVPDVTHITCVGNDFGYDYVFSRYVDGVGRPGDTLLALSTSGESRNIIKAIDTANEKDMRVVFITGARSNMMVRDGKVLHIRLPSGVTNHVQELTMQLLHVLVELIEQKLKDKDNDH